MDIRESRDCADVIQRHFWEVARYEFILRLIAGNVPSPEFVADIGCGDCFVLQALAKQFPDSKFIGTDTALTENMIEKLTAHSKNMTLFREFEQIPGEKKNLLLLLDVLEHVSDEKRFLHSLYKFLDRESKIIVTVPAFQALFTDHDRYLKHFRRYNRKELEQVLENAGLKVTSSGYIFCSLLPFRILQKLLGVKSAEKDNLSVKNIFLNKFAAWVLKMDAALSFRLSKLKIYLPGLSCFAVAELNERK